MIGARSAGLTAPRGGADTAIAARLVLRVAYWPAASTNSNVRVLLISICKLILPPFGAGLDIVIG